MFVIHWLFSRRVLSFIMLVFLVSCGVVIRSRVYSMLSTWGFSAFLKGSTAYPLTSQAGFGFHVASSNTGFLVVGAPNQNNRGAVYSYRRNFIGNWAAMGDLRNPNSGNDLFGFGVAAFGDIVVVGAPFFDPNPLDENPTAITGAIYAYKWDERTQTYLTVGFVNSTGLTSLRGIPPGPVTGDLFGSSMTMNEYQLAVTRHGKNHGEVVIYDRDPVGDSTYPGGYLRFRSVITNPDQSFIGLYEDVFGSALTFAGPQSNIIFIASPLNDSGCAGVLSPQTFLSSCLADDLEDAGAVYGYDTSAAPQLVTVIKSPNPELDQTFGGVGDMLTHGDSVAFDQNLLVVGARNSMCTNASGGYSLDGAVFVYQKAGSSWLSFDSGQKLCGSSGTGFSGLGGNVSVSSNHGIILASAWSKDVGGLSSAGGVYAWILDQGIWTERSLESPFPSMNESFGFSIGKINDDSGFEALVLAAPGNAVWRSGVWNYSTLDVHPNEIRDVTTGNSSGAVWILEPKLITREERP